MARGQRTDGDIIADLRQGIDPEGCFKELWDKYYERVISYFLRHRFPVEDSQDLAQETLYKAFHNLFDLNEPERFASWLFAIAASTYKNEIRDRSAVKRRTTREAIGLEEITNEAADLAPPGNPTTLDRLITEETLQSVDRELESLPPQARRCLTLRIDRRLKYREIAELLQISIGTVKSHIHMARSRLKEQLSPDATSKKPKRG